MLVSPEMLALPPFTFMAEILFRTKISEALFSGLAPDFGMCPAALPISPCSAARSSHLSAAHPRPPRQRSGDAYLPLMRYEQQPGLGLAVRKHVLAKCGAIASATKRRPGPALSVLAVKEVEKLIERQVHKLDLLRGRTEFTTVVRGIGFLISLEIQAECHSSSSVSLSDSILRRRIRPFVPAFSRQRVMRIWQRAITAV